MTLLNELPDAPLQRPWVQWSLARWEQYLADQHDALARAKERGDVTEQIEACIHMAEHQIRRRVCVSKSGRLSVQVVRDVHDLTPPEAS